MADNIRIGDKPFFQLFGKFYFLRKNIKTDDAVHLLAEIRIVPGKDVKCFMCQQFGYIFRMFEQPVDKYDVSISGISSCTTFFFYRWLYQSDFFQERKFQLFFTDNLIDGLRWFLKQSRFLIIPITGLCAGKLQISLFSAFDANGSEAKSNELHLRICSSSFWSRSAASSCFRKVGAMLSEVEFEELWFLASCAHEMLRRVNKVITLNAFILIVLN